MTKSNASNDESLERAAQLLREADGLLVTAGAGMGVDSGLPDFRGTAGFWRAYPALKADGTRFESIANPAGFHSERRGIPPEQGGQEDDEVPLETDALGIVDLRRLTRRLHRASRGGMFPASLASDAADAIDLLLDVLAGAAVIADAAGQEIRGLWERAASTRPRRRREMAGDVTRRSLNDLSAEELDRLRLINQKLAEAEQWILQRRDQCLADYFRAGGVKNHHHGETVHEDVEIEVEIVCILRSDHPDFDDKDMDDNAVARLHWLDDIYDGSPEITNWNAFQFSDGHVLQHENHCYLFHCLYDHVLLHEWDRILAIGAVWVDVHLIQQRETYWDRE